VRRSLPLLAVLALAAMLASCSATDGGGIRRLAAADAVAELGGRTVIDVRTPAETVEGMLAGALNIRLEAADFRDRITALDRDGSYLLYCRTGNRSGQAATIMRDLGFTDVIDAGGYDALVTAGAPSSP